MANKRMAKIFITGASSFIGNNLVDVLKNTFEISVLEHKTGIAKNGVRAVRGGLEDIEKWKENLSGTDIVIHLAAITHSKYADLYNKINIEGTLALIQASEKYGVKQFIFISTRAIGENCGAYGLSKEKAEKYLKESSLNYTILRVGEAYDDTMSKAEGLGSIFSLIKKSPIVPYFVDPTVTLAPIHIDNVRDCIVASVGNPHSFLKTYLVAGLENLSTKEVIVRMCKKVNKKRFLIPVPTIFAKAAFFVFSHLFKNTAPDQLERFLCKKEGLSANVLTDLKVSPRKFLE